MAVFESLSHAVIGAAIEVHRVLGPGMLESAYEECLVHELGLREIAVKRQFPVPVFYKNVRLDCGYRIDILAEDQIVVELKSVDSMLPVHEAQLLTYMHFARKKIGLLINFNVKVLKEGLRRFVF